MVLCLLCWLLLCCFFFFFKQKTAYDVRISDWSSDVCSSDLHGGAGKRQAALLDDLGIARLVGVVHHHDDALDARDKVHRAAHAFDHLAWHGPVREIAVDRHLNRAEDRKIDTTAAAHRETVSRLEEARRRKRCDRLLSGVEEIGIN